MSIENATGWNEKSLNLSLNLYKNKGVGYLLSVHDGDPGTTGENIVSNTKKQSCSFEDAVNGECQLSKNVDFTMKKGDEVHWIGRWLEDPEGSYTFHGYKAAAKDEDGNMVPVTFEGDGTLTVTEHTLGARDIQPS